MRPLRLVRQKLGEVRTRERKPTPASVEGELYGTGGVLLRDGAHRGRAV